MFQVLTLVPRCLSPVCVSMLVFQVAHFKEYIPQAFPGGHSMILDAEVLLIDTKTSKPLPFGTLGVHKVRTRKPICTSVSFFPLSDSMSCCHAACFLLIGLCCHASRFSSPLPSRKRPFKMPRCASLFSTASISTASASWRGKPFFGPTVVLKGSLNSTVQRTTPDGKM